MALLPAYHLWLILVVSLVLVDAQTEPPGPVHPGIPSNCNKWHLVKSGDDCGTVRSQYDLTADEFFGWNPAVSRNCVTNFWLDYAYCVGIGEVLEPTKTTRTSEGTSTTRMTTPPGPTFTGSPSNCNSWYLIKSGDNCDNVPKRFGITRAEFLSYNPAISQDCTVNFWLGQAYCVGLGPPITVTSTSTTPSSETSSETSSFNSTYSIRHPITSVSLTIPTLDDTWPPTKTQDGQPSYCSNWHRVTVGQTCLDIVRLYGDFMSLADFFAWNPTVGTDCSGLYLDFFVCVDIKVQTTGVITIPNFAANMTLPPFVSWSEPPLPTVDPSFTPTPSHGPMPADCLDYMQARAGFTCEDFLEAQPMISREQFFEWNPVLDGKCDGIWANNYYCVAYYPDGMFPQPPTVNEKPEQLPDGTTSECVVWYESAPGVTCALIAAMFGSFDEADFKAWNPSVGSDCSMGEETEGTWYCVGVPGTPTTRTSPVVIPTTPPSGTNYFVSLSMLTPMSSS